jgi:hypothetical protein
MAELPMKDMRRGSASERQVMDRQFKKRGGRPRTRTRS